MATKGKMTVMLGTYLAVRKRLELLVRKSQP
jgi:hypothetical protein